jgi:hypothetical protein
VSLLKLKLNLFFEKQIWLWYKESRFFFQGCAQCKESGFLFCCCACSPFLPDSKAEIEKTVGVCSSAKAYYFEKQIWLPFPAFALSAKNLASFCVIVLVRLV